MSFVVFQWLQQHGLKLWTDKCKLLQQEVKFLGDVVDRIGVRPDPDENSKCQNGQVRAFLGLVGYYRRFVSGYAKVARPLNC